MTLVLKGKEEKATMFFYLKINRQERYTFRNLQHWIHIVEGIKGADYCILCDNDDLKRKVLEQVHFTRNVRFMKSCKSSPELRDILPDITDDRWRNAGYAHLTTFLDAKKNGYSCFWNIDADDTCICLSPERVAELLHIVEDYTLSNKIDIISLDMWMTRTRGYHWTFGITFVNNKVDWFSIMKIYARDEELKAKQIRNVDGYFSCLKECTDLKIETFYVEKLRFIHYSDDFIKRPDASGFFIWENGRLILPILLYCLGIERCGSIPIYEKVIPLDMKICAEECTEFLMNYILPGERERLNVR